VDALAGRVDDVLAAAGRFRDAWTLSGRAHAPTLAPAAAAVAMVHGLRGDGPARAEWLAVVADLEVAGEQQVAYRAVFDAVVLLHEGRAAEALAGLAAEPDELDQRVVWVWRHWYSALRAESAVLAGDPSAREHLVRARTVVAGDPVAGAIVDRAFSRRRSARISGRGRCCWRVGVPRRWARPSSRGSVARCRRVADVGGGVRATAGHAVLSPAAIPAMRAIMSG
jgi:hypothetical protein